MLPHPPPHNRLPLLLSMISAALRRSVQIESGMDEDVGRSSAFSWKSTSPSSLLPSLPHHTSGSETDSGCVSDCAPPLLQALIGFSLNGLMAAALAHLALRQRAD